MISGIINDKYLYISMLILQCIIWGVSNPIIKIGLKSIPPFYSIAFRFTLASAVFITIFRKKLIHEFKKEYIKDCVTIGLFNATTFILTTVSIKLTTATIAGFLMGLSVLFTPFMTFIILKKKPHKVIYWSTCITIIGMYLLCGGSKKFSFGLGEILALFSSVTLAATLIYTSKHVCNMGAELLSTVQTVFTAVIALLFAVFFENFTISQVTPEGLGAILYLALGTTCIAYMLQNYALKRVSPLLVSLIFCSEPIFSAIASYILLDEALSFIGLLGAGLIIIGIVAASIINFE